MKIAKTISFPEELFKKLQEKRVRGANIDTGEIPSFSELVIDLLKQAIDP